MEHFEQLSQTLLNLRSKHRFTQDYVAHKLGVSQPQYSRMELGQKDAMLGGLVKMGGLYRMDVHDLLETIMRTSGGAPAALKKQAQEAYGSDLDLAFYKKLADHWEQKAFTYMRMFVALCQQFNLDCDSREERHAFTLAEADIIKSGKHLMS